MLSGTGRPQVPGGPQRGPGRCLADIGCGEDIGVTGGAAGTDHHGGDLRSVAAPDQDEDRFAAVEVHIGRPQHRTIYSGGLYAGRECGGIGELTAGVVAAERAQRHRGIEPGARFDAR